MKLKGSYKWPKQLPELTAEQLEIRDDFMRFWHERLASNQAFGILEKFNHGYAVKNAPAHFKTTLEIGAGLGEHLVHEHLTDEQRKNYVPVELRSNMVEKIRERFPDVPAVQGDCQQRIDFPDGSFDRILAIHVLEHLPNLPATIKEMYRLCNKESGVLSVVIPCEDGLAHRLGRFVSAEQMFRRRYGQSFKWCADSEHISIPDEIIQEISKYFDVAHKEFFPLKIPVVSLNLVMGLTCKPKQQSEVSPIADRESAASV